MTVGEPGASIPPGRLARWGFTDATRAARLLAGAHLPEAVAEALATAADPDLALTTLVRILEAPGAPAGLVDELVDAPQRCARLVAVIGASAALGSHLTSHPEDVAGLLGEAGNARPSAYGLRSRLLTAVGADPGAEHPRADGTMAQALDAMRLAYRRGLLDVAARDLVGDAAVDDVAAELADLAAAALEAALATARSEITEQQASVRLAVIAMGKCGGRELNYVSDVDVVFVAEPGPGVDEHEALRVATRLAEGLMRACSATTPEGTVFPVDAGLRPEGRSGPLVRTLASHEAYYRRWARTWEFQALLKARPVAGDLELGRRWCEMVDPLVWTADGREGFVADVQAMRRRVEQSVPAREADRQLKLGRGGLRDIEFAVQLLQLVHGRADPQLRSGATLPALQALTEGGYVGEADGLALADSYRFLRTAEHRLQLQRLRRTHTLPGDEAGMRWLARAMGYTGDAAEALELDRQRHAREVRRLHEKLFYRPLLDAVARLPASETRLSLSAAGSRLEALGFSDTRGALRHIEELSTGVSRRAAIQRTLLPVMLGWFAEAADPDAGLLAFRQVSDALGSTPWYLRMLRDEGAAAERLARLLASSRYVADMLTRAPEGITMLADDDQLVPRDRGQVEAELLSLARRTDDWEAAVVAIRGSRRHELLRVACADLLGLLDPVAVGHALTDVADATIAAALDVATRKVSAEWRGPLPMRLAVVGMGRLGGREAGYGSDADVVFVYDAEPGALETEATPAAHAVAEELRRLLALPAPDPPLVVDADLRPEGKQGPLVRSLDSYVAYYRRWSVTWESQALLRAAPAAGDPRLTADFLGAVDEIRYRADFGLEQVREVRRLKARMEAERLPRGADRTLHLKLGPGGLSDVEWVIQLLTLQRAHEVPALRTTSTLDGLRVAAAEGLIEGEDARILVEAWTSASRLRNAIMLVTGRASDSLPSSGRDLAGVARAVGYPAGEQQRLIEDHRRLARRARAVFERLFYG